MGTVICHIPITVRVVGELTPEHIEAAAVALEATVGPRVETAKQELSARGYWVVAPNRIDQPPTDVATDAPPYAPELDGYLIPSFKGGGKKIPIPAAVPSKPIKPSTLPTPSSSPKAAPIGVELKVVSPEEEERLRKLGVNLPPAAPTKPRAVPQVTPIPVELHATPPDEEERLRKLRVHLPIVRREAVDPRKHSDFIDNRLTAIAYGVFLGGYLLYCKGLGGIPLFVPESFVDLRLNSVLNVSDLIYPDYPTAQAAIPPGPSAVSLPTPVAYYWSPIGHVVLPTLFCPATTPYTVEMMWGVRRDLAKYVERQLTPIAYGLAFGIILRVFVGVLTRVPAVEEPIAAPVSRLTRPVGGRINVGGGLETGSESASNLQPFVEGTGGPAAGAEVPNLVQGRFENIGELFEPGSTNLIYSNRLPFGTVEWPQAASGAYRVLAPGGKLSLNVWANPEEAKLVVDVFRQAGFRNVSSSGSGVGTIISGVRP